jgi:hypothetical protein
MIVNYHPHLSLLVIAFILLLLLPIVNCTSDQMKIPSIEKPTQSTSVKNHFYDTLKREKLDYDRKEEIIRHLIEDFIKTYPYRRASTFQAMRGKRSVNTA